MKYLMVDRSLSTGRDVIGRFQVREGCSLPKFCSEAPEVPVEVRTSSPWWQWLHRMAGRAQPAQGAAIVSGSEAGDRRLVARTDDGAETSTVVPAVALSGLPPVKRCAQTEFRFDHVRVVCNDLHDADFELVAASVEKREPRALAATPELATA